MKRALLILAMVLSMVVGTAFACDADSSHDTTGSATATATAIGGNATGGSVGAITNTNTANGGAGGAGGQGGAGGSATIQKGAVTNNNSNIGINTNVNNNSIKNDIKNDIKNTNLNVQGQTQGQKQNQKQGQKQNQNNNQSIAPVQETVVTTPQNLLPLPSQEVPSLHFGSGHMMDVTRELPLFALYGIRPLENGDRILEVLKVDANVKFKNLYETILKDGAKVASSQNGIIMTRFQVIRAESQKTWTTGGNFGGGGSGLSSGGLGGGSGAGSVIPQIGRTKADDLFTIIFVKTVK